MRYAPMHFAGITNIDELLKKAGEDFGIEDMKLPVRLSPTVKKKMSNAVHMFGTNSETGNKYYDEIPMESIRNAIKQFGYTTIQEDNTEWAGWLTGESGNEYFQLGTNFNKEGFYEPVVNAQLALSWYKMPSGKYEITTYIG